MSSVFNLIKWGMLAPFKIIKFVVADILIYGIIGGIMSLCKSIVKLLFKPISLCAILGGVLLFVLSDEDRRNKARAMLGL